LVAGCLYVLLPFAYFYYEAEGLEYKHWLPRLYEAALVLVLVAGAVYGVAYVLRQLLPFAPGDPVTFLYAVVVGVGALLLADMAPRGIPILVQAARCVPFPPPPFPFVCARARPVDDVGGTPGAGGGGGRPLWPEAHDAETLRAHMDTLALEVVALRNKHGMAPPAEPRVPLLLSSDGPTALAPYATRW
jgi:hypothetical protein